MSSVPPPRQSANDGRQTRWSSSLVQARERIENASDPSALYLYLLAALIGVYALLTFLACRRHLWHDELFTYYIAAAPSWKRLWQEIPLDLNPPLEFLSVRAAIAAFGNSNYAIRLPSMLGFLAGSLCLYAFVRRRLSGAYGILAILVVWASPFFYYATEARPYALTFSFLGLALVAWQSAIDERQRSLSIFLLAAAVTGMMLSHLLALIYLAPLCLAEFVRTLKRRKVDAAVCAALLIPCVIPFIYVRLMARFEASLFPPVFQASLQRAVESYFGTLRLEAIPLILGVGGALLATADRRWPKLRLHGFATAVDWALAAGFVSIPVLVNLALMRSHGAYFDRYALPVECGYALATVFFLSYLTQQSRLAAAMASGVLLLFFCAYNFGPGLRDSVWKAKAAAEQAPKIEDIRPDLPLVAASGLTFIEMDRYASTDTVRRLYYLTDREMAARYAHATIFEGMPDVKRHFPIRANVSAFQEFLSAHASFLVLGDPNYPEDWLLKALLARGALVQYLGRFAGPYKDDQLYLVTLTRTK